MTGLDRALVIRLGETNMHIVTNRGTLAYLKRLDASGLSCAEVNCLVATKSIGDGYAWSVLVMSYFKHLT